MPSPFPGMDPYLEHPALWTGVHQRLITYLGDALQTGLGRRYFAQIGERLYVVLIAPLPGTNSRGFGCHQPARQYTAVAE